MVELKPCPFCGCEAEVFDFEDGRYIVECSSTDCDVFPYTRIHKSRREAIDAWNRRVDD